MRAILVCLLCSTAHADVALPAPAAAADWPARCADGLRAAADELAGSDRQFANLKIVATPFDDHRIGAYLEVFDSGSCVVARYYADILESTASLPESGWSSITNDAWSSYRTRDHGRRHARVAVWAEARGHRQKRAMKLFQQVFEPVLDGCLGL